MIPLSLFQRQPWLITPESFSHLTQKAAGLFERSESQTNEPHNSLLQIKDGIGIITIHGPLIRKPDLISRLFFDALDHEEVAAAIREAVTHTEVSALFLDIDSPGGTVSGTPELAQAVADASKEKYIHAFTAGQLCSAAYWIASPCDAIYATPSARVGSIGVILPLIDSSEAYQMAGLKVEVFAAGKFKSTGTPGVPLNDDQRAWLQADVEEIFADFKTAVLARGRKIPAEAMQGQTFSARQAQRLNLSGVVKDRTAALARLRQLHGHKVDTRVQGMTPNLEEQLHDAQLRSAVLEQEAQTREVLLTEAAQSITLLTEERTTLLTENKTLREREAALTARNATLEAAEQNLEQRAAFRAAQIAAEMGSPVPVAVTPQSENIAADLLAEFNAITDPTAQSKWWRTLSATQKAQLLNAQEVSHA